ncbi:hypothetical protein PR202_ga24840 [Eleusine coracana subsp. coracana]|uniref:E3 ubiquitin-protein ligase listerin n=1 Tax=Eleusine coracana subsp. coracana TaxID=191504 RepID=A0AAV5DA08_ELECO|nr:hypothetical protein PR202_ga24840 [Eleusine coracana subsp. coracana]
MGKQKGRASSSGLAASLVQQSQGAVPAFGFGGYHGATRVEPATTSDPEAPIRPTPDVDSEVLQHLKRLGRKDPTTKLKALSVLSVIFGQKSGDEVVQIVPQWAFEYKRLLLDYNREVRRATHETMSSLVRTVKKGIAPHLKSLMGPWWFSQFDPAPEVAQAARRSFEAAFPQSERRIDALMLCVKEIFLYLNENLKLTTQALSDKATPMDELEDMHQRVISSSMLAMATLIDILLGVKLQNCDVDNTNTDSRNLSKVRSTTLSSAETAFCMHKYFLGFLKSESAVVRFWTPYHQKQAWDNNLSFEFLHNLWAGRNQRQVSAADSSAFCIAIKQCFLWLLKNVSRYSFLNQYSGGDSSNDIHTKLIIDILVGSFGDTPSLVNLLLVLVEIFGPTPLLLKNYQKNSENSDMKSYLEMFSDDFLPWCLNGKYGTCSSKIDLLLTLFQDDCFNEQWCSVIKYIRAGQKHPVDAKTSNIMDQFEIFTLLLQKVRERIAGRKLINLNKNGYLPEHWRHDLLDSMAVSVFCDSPPADSHANFLCAALGGSDQEDRVCFLSAETVRSIIEFILKNLASVLVASNFEWARFAYELLLPAEHRHLKFPEKQSSSVNFGMAHFSFGVLKGSLSSLVLLEEDSVFPAILASLFIIEWECNMALILGEENDMEGRKDDIDIGASDEEVHLKVNLAESINAFCQSLSSSFWNNLRSCTLNRLANILAQSVRFAVFHTRELHDDMTAVLCSEWVVDMLKLICIDHITLQIFFDLLLSESECWPLWLVPSLQNGHPSMKVRFEPAITDEIELKHQRFVAFVDNLTIKLGFGEVILGIPGNLHRSMSQSTDITSSINSLSRAWVADVVDWMQVALSCFPLRITGGGQNLENDWHFLFRMIFKWIESSVLLVEEMTDGINDAIINLKSSEDALEKIKLVVNSADKLTISLAESALVALCQLNHLGNIQEAENSHTLQLIRSGDYAESSDKMVESILRLFLASGVSEAIAKSRIKEASSIIGSSRHSYLHFWELVASFINHASPQIRRSSLESMELWGLNKDSVSGLYSILFSSQPIFHLQFAAFSLLLSEPFCQLSLVKERSLGDNCSPAQHSDIDQNTELMPDSEKTLHIRDELSALIEFPTSELLKRDLIDQDRVKDSIYADENFSVSVNRSAYEIVATYKKEETGIDLVIRLPNCYPLRHVDVDCTRSLGISEVKCRKWLLSLTSFVRNQNGAIAEAICTWKSNFDKEFEGVEECPICYSILHTSNHSLPKLACKTCKHKFHGVCLYKWFSTSNKSTCPLCQTPF